MKKFRSGPANIIQVTVSRIKVKNLTYIAIDIR